MLQLGCAPVTCYVMSVVHVARAFVLACPLGSRCMHVHGRRVVHETARLGVKYIPLSAHSLAPQLEGEPR
jgi:hypothetical protein